MQLLEDVLGLRTLHRDSCILVRDIGDLDVERLRLLIEVREVLIDVAGVDDQQIFGFFKAVQIDIVNDAALCVRQQRILGLVYVQRQHVAGEHMLEIGKCAGTLDVETSHVGDIEDTAHTAAVEVLGKDAAGVLDRHIPAAEVHHRGTGCDMRIVQNGSLEFAHVVVSSFSFLLCGFRRALAQ